MYGTMPLHIQMHVEYSHFYYRWIAFYNFIKGLYSHTAIKGLYSTSHESVVHIQMHVM